MRKILLALLAFFIFTHSFAQRPKAAATPNYAIQGTVHDGVDQKLLSFATISVSEAGNQNILFTTISDGNGVFQFFSLPSKPLILSISYLGFKNKSIDILPVTNESLDLGKIFLTPSSTQLEEIQVIADRFLIEQHADKLIYNADMDPDSHFLNALELLGKVPFLSLDGDDNLQLNGSDNYQVLINGKLSSLFIQNPSEVFRAIPANTIKSIEIITNPPARYDSEGVGGIINITTYGKSIKGYNGSITTNGTDPTGGALSTQLAINFGKINISTLGGYNMSTSPTANRSVSREDRIRNTYLIQLGENSMLNKGYNFGGELMLDLGPRTQISTSYRSNSRLGTSIFTQEVEMINSRGERIQAYNNQNDGQSSSVSSDLSVDFHQSFKKNSARQLTMSYRLGRNSMEQFSAFTVDAIMNHVGKISQTENDNQTMEQNFLLDYVHPFKNKQKFEFGFKSNLRLNKSEYYYKDFDQQSNDYLIVERLSNQFEHQQDIHAAYTSLQFNLGKWVIRSGARGELTSVKANFYSLDTIALLEYLNIIPNINISRKLKRNSIIRASYTQRLERPGVWQLNPYVNLTDPRNISYGNPTLDPATNHSFNFGYNTFFKKTSINTLFFYNFANNSIQQFTSLQEDTVAHTTYGNVGLRKIYGFSLGSNFTLFEKLNLNINSSSQYAEITRILNDEPQTNAGFIINATANFGYRISKSWRINGNVGYTSPQILLQGRSASFLSNNFSLNKQFNNRGNISFAVRNPLQKYRRFQNEVNDPSFRQVQESFSVIRQYTLSINYRFGKLHASQSRKKTSSPIDAPLVD